LPIRTYTHTTTTNSAGNPAIRPHTRRLSWIIQNPSSGSTQYLVNNSGDTTSEGLILTTGSTLKSNWFDDSGLNTNRSVSFIVSTGTAELKIIETLADTQEEYDRKITGVRN
jgi:hypothetical protein